MIGTSEMKYYLCEPDCPPGAAHGFMQLISTIPGDRAMPKSMILALPPLSTMMFCGFTSR